MLNLDGREAFRILPAKSQAVYTDDRELYLAVVAELTERGEEYRVERYDALPREKRPRWDSAADGEDICPCCGHGLVQERERYVPQGLTMEEASAIYIRGLRSYKEVRS